ncbi:hypothetical protein A7U43_27875 (plasmid) [Mycobacterium adipatum]|uniref:EamA domain-containing protein n=1 Tax=Mycobacterium adipatum TaxID=1682113 RepID=A0A172UW83_9MYCO|nr:DMT family transporter [Mycobacterium adipatum]ANE83352.1 hypothetical protein A7U43_27875 [Mycobacterium adipatum]
MKAFYHARAAVLAGAAATALSGSFIKLSETSSSTSTFFRCLMAAPLLAYFAGREFRRRGLPSRRILASQILAGAMLGADFALWAQSVTLVGAGISTVVVNIQVVVVPVLTWAFLGIRPPLRFVAMLPLLLTGAAVAGGVTERGDNGQLLLGTVFALAAGVTYGIYLFIIGRTGVAKRLSSQVFVSTATAGIVGAGVGSFWDPVDLTPSWSSLGWLAVLALSSQILGWTLISAALPRVSADVGAALLLTQPVMAVGFAMLLVNERPSAAQMGGCAAVVAAVWFLTRSVTGRH